MNKESLFYNKCSGCGAIHPLGVFDCDQCESKRWDGWTRATEQEVEKARLLPCPKLPNGWTLEDLDYLKHKEEETGNPILVADSDLGVTTIHDIRGADHLGFGLFRASGDGYTLYFDAGGSMHRTPSGKGWTYLRIEGEYPEKDQIMDRFRRAYELYHQFNFD